MLFIYLMIGLHQKNNCLLPRMLAGQKKHIHTFLLLDFKAAHIYAHIYADNKVKLRE